MLNITDRAFIYILHGSVCDTGFHALHIHQSEGFSVLLWTSKGSGRKTQTRVYVEQSILMKV